MRDFEKTFSDFIDGPEYDMAESGLLAVVRASYAAGWMAAGGNPPPVKAVEPIHKPTASASPREE